MVDRGSQGINICRIPGGTVSETNILDRMVRIKELLNRNRIRTAFNAQNKICICAGCLHVAGIDAGTKIDFIGIIAGKTIIKNRVLSKTRIEQIFVAASPTFKQVVTGTATQYIIAVPTLYGVVASGTINTVYNICASKKVVSFRARYVKTLGQQLIQIQGHAVGKCEELNQSIVVCMLRIEVVYVYLLTAISNTNEQRTQSQTYRICVNASPECNCVRVGCTWDLANVIDSIPQIDLISIIASTTAQCVIARTTNQQIVAIATGNRIRARITDQSIVVAINPCCSAVAADYGRQS